MNIREMGIYVILAMVIAGVGHPQRLWASENGGANFLVEVGERDLRRGNVQQALHEFSKALMLDPAHARALHYMKEYGFADGLYSGSSTRVSEAARFALEQKKAEMDALAQETEMAKTREILDQVKAHRDQISRELTDKNLQLYAMQAQVGALSSELDENDHRFEGQVSQLEKLYASIEQEMAKVREQEAGYLQMTQGDLGRVHAYENELITLQQEYNLLREKEHEFQRRQQDLYYQMEQYAYVRSRLIDDLSDELIYKDLDIAMKDSYVSAKLEQIEHLDTLIEGHRRQIAEQYETIQEQSQNIDHLQKRLEGESEI